MDFAKEVFQLMADGNADAAGMLDRENLNMVGVDMGAQYRTMDSESARQTFRESFLRGYANSFKSSGGNAALIKNRREQSTDAFNTIVAGDVPNVFHPQYAALNT